jgi:hypothetical protein
MSISSRLQMEVFTRDGFACVYCGGKPGASHLEVDHFLPRSKRGSDAKLNLVTACSKCNRLKGNKYYIPKALGLPEDEEGYALILSRGVWGLKIGSGGVYLSGAVYRGNSLTSSLDCWELDVLRIDQHTESQVAGKTWGPPHSMFDFSTVLELARSLVTDL